jgi:hypothetical protein
MELGFRWNAMPRAVVVNFRKFAGSRYSARNIGKQIALEGEEIRQVVEGDEAYSSVVLSGVISGSIAAGTYYCKYVHFLVLGRGWVLVFENLHLSIRVVDDLPAHRERAGAWLYGVRFLG